MIRLPCQAGTFYEASPNALRKQIEGCFQHRLGPGSIPRVVNGPRSLIALISPHAGYMFSGPIAAHSYHFAALDGRPDTIIIIGPNHTGYGSGLSIMVQGVWRMPLGDVEVDAELAKKVQHASELIDIDNSAHRFEHSIEVQLPFLQYIYGSTFKFIPICMRMQDLETCRDLGNAIAKTVSNRKVLIVGSTDLSHYEPHKVAETKDRLVIDSILSLDANNLQSTVLSNSISMCGYGPCSVVIIASEKMGATHSRLLSYHTSGIISGDYSNVVGYASLVITR